MRLSISSCLFLLWTTLFFFGACGPGEPHRITRSMELPEAKKAPEITRVLDLGDGEVPTAGNIQLIGMNSEAVIGELLYLEGLQFGRGPSVAIGGLPAMVLARTAGGGILVRVPQGVPAGEQNIVVSTPRGISTKSFKFRRFAAAGSPGQKMVSLMEAPSFGEVHKIDAGEPAAMAFSRTKPLLYIVTQTDYQCREKAGSGCIPKLLTVDLTMADFPVIQKQDLIPGFVLDFSLDREQDMALVATTTGMQMISLEYRSPIVYRRTAWPSSVPSTDVLSAILSPDGKTAAVLLGQDNQLALFDVSVPDVPKPGPMVKLLPQEKAPLVKTMAFFSTRNNQVLYIAFGDTPQSLVVGYHAGGILVTELVSARDRTVDPELNILKNIPLHQEKVTPLHLAVTPWGAIEVEDTQRTEWTHFVYMAMAHGEMMTLSQNPLSTPSGLQIGVELFEKLKTQLGTLARMDFRHALKSYTTDPAVTGALAPSHDGRTMLSVRCLPKGTREPLDIQFDCGLHLLSFQTLEGEFRPMGTIARERFLSPFRFGAVAVQE